MAPFPREPPDRAFLAGAAATFFFLLAAFELAARFAAGSGWLYRRFDFSGTLDEPSGAAQADRLERRPSAPGLRARR